MPTTTIHLDLDAPTAQLVALRAMLDVLLKERTEARLSRETPDMFGSRLFGAAMSGGVMPATSPAPGDVEAAAALSLPLRGFDVATPAAPTAYEPPAVATVDDEPAASYTPGELDSRGLPWDERIHAATHAKNANGTWRQRRGVDEALVLQVTNELRGVTAAPPSVPAPPPAPVAAAVPAPPPAPAAAPTLLEAMGRITQAMAAGTITQTQLVETLASLQLPNGLLSLSDQPEQIPAVLDGLGLNG